MDRIEEVRERLQKVLDKKETFMFDYRNDIRILFSVIDEQATEIVKVRRDLSLFATFVFNISRPTN